ncbi:transposase [Holospora obtusa]
MKELIEFLGCQVIFLPPYSPDLNPIEKFLANMKRWIKKKINQFDKFYEAITVFFQILFSCLITIY